MVITGERHVRRELQDALGTHEVGVEVRSERIAAPSDARDVNADLAQECVVDGDAERSLGGKLLQHCATNDSEDGLARNPVAGEKTIISGPVVELLAASGQQASHGVSPEAEQTAQREGLGTLGDAVLGEGGVAFSPELVEGGEDAGRVFFKSEGGG